IASSTLLDFHRALVTRKYSRLFSRKAPSKPGPKGPSKDLIRLVVETKENNRNYGCPRIALLVGNVLGTTIDEETVRRILAKHFRPLPGNGPSCLLPIGNSHNKLWSMDLFRLESCFLKTFWVMVVMDQFTRKIVGFSVQRGPIDGGAICFMFNKICLGKDWPKYLSTDNDPLFQHWLWKVNLEHQYHIDEIKTVPYCPWSHPFVERLIGTCRREFTDNILIWSKADLEMKLNAFQEYFNSYRVHYSHDGKTPDEFNGERRLANISLNNFSWNPVCGGMYHTPIAA
ncbi:MAG: integrase core domain-containing protein, partial [Proteobacteria bacterium]|nr:integrase core domain-containing protein [Pseudomonadota bacterium]